MKTLRYLSVCSGIEAATVAWHPLGFVPVAFSEIESFPCAVLQHHYPQVPNLGDMTRFQDWPDYAIELLVGGTPCQSFSVAGLRKGLADPRGNLALTFLAIVDRYRPRWVVWENVPGVHSSWSDVTVRGATERADEVERSVRELALEAGLDGETIEGCGGFEEADQSSDFDGFLAGLEELGYGVASTILDAQFFGVAQRRERVFVVGHAGGQWQRAAAVLFERAGLCGHPAPRRQTREGTTYSTSPSLTGSGRGTERAGESRGQDCVIPIQEIGKRTGRSTDDVACGIGIGQQHDPMFTLQQGAVHRVCATLTKNYATHHGRSAGNNGGVAENQLIPEAIPINMQAAGKNGAKSPNMVGVGEAGDPSPTLNAGDRHAVGVPVTIAFSAKDDGRDATDNLSPTLRSCNHDQSHANAGCNVAVALAAGPHSVDGALPSQHTPNGHGCAGVNSQAVEAGHIIPEIVGTLSDGAHMGGGLTGRTPTAEESSLPSVAWALQERDSKGTDSKGTDSDTKEGHLIPTPQGGFFNYQHDYASAPKTHTGTLLRTLLNEIGEETFTQWGLGILAAFQSTEVLRQVVHGKGIRLPAFSRSWMVHCALSRAEDRGEGIMQSVREAQCAGCSSQGRQPSEQLARQLGAYLSELSQPGAQAQRFLLDLWQASEGTGLLRETLSAVQEVERSTRIQTQPAQSTYAVRRLTVTECEFLQGFPRHYTLIPYGKKAVDACPDGPRYKALGNSMCVNVMRWLGERIQQVEAIP